MLLPLIAFLPGEEPSLPETAAELGKMLFNDPLLSGDRSISCASCHKPEFAFADTAVFSTGVNGKRSQRNTPTVMNVLMREQFFWDGRTASLEAQALLPIENPDEMNLPIAEAIKRLNENSFYRKAFKKIYGKIADSNSLSNAISAFERTLESSNTTFDRFMQEKDSLDESELRGLDIFNEKGNCLDCHFGPDLTGDEFINIGLYNANDLTDNGRFGITKDSADLGAFKVPGLRNIFLTAPYMHNGMFQTLEEVVEYYNDPDQVIPNSINRSDRIRKLRLSAQEKTDLVAFLKTLTEKQFVK